MPNRPYKYAPMARPEGNDAGQLKQVTWSRSHTQIHQHIPLNFVGALTKRLDLVRLDPAIVEYLGGKTPSTQP
jgi:hypothetical protein